MSGPKVKGEEINKESILPMVLSNCWWTKKWWHCPICTPIYFCFILFSPRQWVQTETLLDISFYRCQQWCHVSAMGRGWVASLSLHVLKPHTTGGKKLLAVSWPLTVSNVVSNIHFFRMDFVLEKNIQLLGLSNTCVRNELNLSTGLPPSNRKMLLGTFTQF